MRILGLLFACLIALPAAAVAQPDAPVQRGRLLVERNCGMCHAVARSGESPNAAAPPFRDLGDRYPIESLSEALAEGILTGHPAMPEFRFAPAEVKDIVRYLQFIQARKAT